MISEVFDYVGPQSYVGQPIVVRSFRERAVANEEDAGRMVKLGAKRQIG